MDIMGSTAPPLKVFGWAGVCGSSCSSTIAAITATICVEQGLPTVGFSRSMRAADGDMPH